MENPITSIIIDDELDARDGLEAVIKTFLPEVEVLAKAKNATEAIREVLQHRPELIFLDIRMPEHDGFYVAGELNKLGLEPCIIFVTAYDQYAIDAIKHAAFDFILKPVDPDELIKAIPRYKNMKEKESLKIKIERLHACLQPRQLKFPTQTGFVLIEPGEIIFAQADGNYTVLHLTGGGKEIVSLQIGQIKAMLDSLHFVRSGRSHIINLKRIKAFDRQKKDFGFKRRNSCGNKRFKSRDETIEGFLATNNRLTRSFTQTKTAPASPTPPGQSRSKPGLRCVHPVSAWQNR